MQIGFSVRLPGDAHSVPFVRGLCRQALEHLDVDPVASDEMLLALSEASANAVQHAAPGQDFVVEVDIDDELWRVGVVDAGAGFDAAVAAAAEQPASLLDGGSGLRLMRALVDDLDFRLDPDGRHRVTFEKHLRPGTRTPAPSV
jgi:serine/threonine-protein kinase RsbW